MPIATYKCYKCPKCAYTKTLFQGDVITSFPICPKCKETMQITGDAPNDAVNFFKNLLKL